MGFLLVLRRLGSPLCCSEEIGGGSTRRATSSVSLFEGRPASSTGGFFRFRRWCYFVVLKTARKGLARRSLRSTRRSRCGIIVTIVRDNKLVVVVIRAPRKTGCNLMNYMRPSMLIKSTFFLWRFLEPTQRLSKGRRGTVLVVTLDESVIVGGGHTCLLHSP